MAHDFHFLSRLERVGGKALQLALGLYRDTPLLKWTFQRLGLGDHVEIVALPLSDEAAPPYALVSRKGKFITCLAAGMWPGANTTPVSWHLLTTATQELEAWRALHKDNKDRTAEVMSRLSNAGPWLAREDFEDLLIISAVEPNTFARFLSRLVKGVSNVRDTWTPPVGARRLETNRKLCSLTWKCTWASSHAALVLTEAAARRSVFRPGEIPPNVLISWAEIPVLTHHIDGMWVRAGWSLGRLGGLVRPTLLEQAREGITSEVGLGKLMSDPSLQGSMAIFGLLAQAFRDPSQAPELEAELSEVVPASLAALGQDPEVRPQDIWGRLAEGHGMTTALAVSALAHLREARTGFRPRLGLTTSEDELMRQGALFMMGGHKDTDLAVRPKRRAAWPLPPGIDLDAAPSRPTSELVRMELVNVPPLCSYGDVYQNMNLIGDRLHLIPALARREVEQHFFPRAWLEALKEIYTLTTPLEVMQSHLEAEYRSRTDRQRATRTVTPGRNDACACGSGLKYKRCCGK